MLKSPLFFRIPTCGRMMTVGMVLARRELLPISGNDAFVSDCRNTPICAAGAMTSSCSSTSLGHFQRVVVGEGFCTLRWPRVVVLQHVPQNILRKRERDLAAAVRVAMA